MISVGESQSNDESKRSLIHNWACFSANNGAMAQLVIFLNNFKLIPSSICLIDNSNVMYKQYMHSLNAPWVIGKEEAGLKNEEKLLITTIIKIFDSIKKLFPSTHNKEKKELKDINKEWNEEKNELLEIVEESNKEDLIKDGLMPMIYKYLSSFYSYRGEYDTKNSLIHGFGKLIEIAEKMKESHEFLTEIFYPKGISSKIKKSNWEKFQNQYMKLKNYKLIITTNIDYNKVVYDEILQDCRFVCESIKLFIEIYYNEEQNDNMKL